MKSMTKILSVVLVMLFFGLNGQAQEWLTIKSEALSRAEKTGQPIILLFSGSDWCAPCVRLKKEVLNSPTFIDFSKDFVLLNADFPRKKTKDKELVKQNEALAEAFNPKGIFPLVVLMDSKGNRLGSMSYGNEQPTEFIHNLQQAIVVR